MKYTYFFIKFIKHSKLCAYLKNTLKKRFFFVNLKLRKNLINVADLLNMQNFLTFFLNVT